MEENQPDEAYKIPPPVFISSTPSEVDVSEIHLKGDEPVVNAYLVAHTYPHVEIVEGLILIQYTDNGLFATPHVWNKMGDVYFDVTNENCWTDRKKAENIESINYFFVKLHVFEDLQKQGIFEFCFETIENVAAIKDFLFNQHLSKN